MGHRVLRLLLVLCHKFLPYSFQVRVRQAAAQRVLRHNAIHCDGWKTKCRLAVASHSLRSVSTATTPPEPGTTQRGSWLRTKALIYEVIESVSIRREGQLLLRVAGLRGWTLVEALNSDRTEVAAVRRLLRKYRRSFRHHAVYERHGNAAARAVVSRATCSPG